MTPLSSIKHPLIVCLSVLSLFAISCDSSTNVKCADCPDNQEPVSNVNFRITDKASNRDLFFGKNAKYSLEQLSVRHVVNGVADSVAAPLSIDTTRRQFNVNILYQSNADTLVMQIANLKRDTLYLATGISDDCCPHIYVSSASLNGAVIYNTYDGSNKRAVKANMIVIPKKL